MEILRNPEALQEALAVHRIVIVQFGTESCAPCKALQNRIRIWNQAHPDILHIYADVSALPELCAQMGVFAVPAVFVYVEGKLTLQPSGYFSLDGLLGKIEKYQRLLEA